MLQSLLLQSLDNVADPGFFIQDWDNDQDAIAIDRTLGMAIAIAQLNHNENSQRL